MYVDTSKIKNGSKNYTRHLLRTSYRKDGKVLHRTIANISDCSDEEIEAIRLALKHKGDLTIVGAVTDEVEVKQGASFGAVWVIYQIAIRLGIAQALGNSKAGLLALWQVIARVIDQGSRLSAVRLAKRSACSEVLGLNSFDEDDLYYNLDWLEENQQKIEDLLYITRETSLQGIFLYDVTSSYLEGTQNELAAFGYNRDGKKGKRQIVIGLLCDADGNPLSIQVFKGNTQDPKTVANQVDKIKNRFNATDITFVGDRGMIKSQQVMDLNSEGYHYITAITKPQIKNLLNQGVFQMSLFDSELSEITDSNNIRYVLKRNPLRASELAANREEKLTRLTNQIKKENDYLKKHLRASPNLALKRIESQIQKLAISNWVSCSLKERELSLIINHDAKQEAASLDGCYALKTDLTQTLASKEVIHDRYKDLAKVEIAFRSSKTAHLEMRPVFLRLSNRTQAHAFVVMLAYAIIKHLDECWKNLDITVNEGIDALSSLCLCDVNVNNTLVANTIQVPRDDLAQLLQAANLKLPIAMPAAISNVSTRTKLQDRRKH